jgi:GNAT superfamily N-acetyltransferase
VLAVRIRRIGEEEARLLRDLRIRSLRDAPEAFGQQPAEAEAMPEEAWHQQVRAAATGDRRAWFVAELPAEERTVGLVNGRRRPPSELMVFSMWVDPACRQQGIGRRLIDAIDGWASGWGARRTVLWVFGANETAIRFYERIGFAVELNGTDAEIGRSYGALAMSRATQPGC